MLEIRLLGAPEFAIGGEPFRFTAPPRTLPLLAWLLLHRRAPLSRDAVAFAFWPDALEEDARGNLRRHLYYLTRALPPPAGDPWIVADKKTIAWNNATESRFDVVDFERLCGEEATLGEGVALYRGPLLDGYEDDWVEPERERLRSLAESTLLRLIAREGERDPASAIAFAQHLLRIDPLREDAVRHLIGLRHRSGDRAGAMREYRDFVIRLRRELDVDPMPETTAVYESIARADTPLPPPPIDPAVAKPRSTNLPEPASDLIGRSDALAEVCALLASTRVATLAGTGGVGKTRLGIEAGRLVLADFPDGVWFVDCGPLRDASLVVSAIAAAAGIAQATERPEVGMLTAALRRRELLLIIDNCEHLLAEVATVVSEILTSCPDVRVLVTSREPVAVRGERVYRVPSLDVPAAFESKSVAAAREHGAVALFEARATAADPAFALDAENLADVIEICRRLDGIAFALELAAARVAVLAPSELARRLEERFRILTGGERTALPRQRTMRASIDWSWDLCTAAEATLLRRLAVFPGTWTLSAAESICFGTPLEVSEAVELAGALVEKSLLVAERGPGERRYRLLESIRAYAREKLIGAGEDAGIAAAHAAYFAEFGRRIDRDYETLPDAAWYEPATLEIDNVRAALEWSFGPGGDPMVGAVLASAYGGVWRYGSGGADRRYLDMAYERVNRGADDALTARLLWQIAAISQVDGRYADWVAVAVRDRGDVRTKAEMLCWLADVHRRAGRLDEAAAALEEARPLHNPLTAPKAYAAYRLACGKVAASRGDLDEANRLYERAVAAAEGCGAIAVLTETRIALAEAAFAGNDVPRALAAAVSAQATIAGTFGRSVALADVTAAVAGYELAAGNLDAAERAAREALTIAHELDVPQRFVDAIETLAAVAALGAEPELERAAFLLGFADAERVRRDDARGTREADVSARIRAAFGPGSSAEAERRGAIAGIERVLAEALDFSRVRA